MSQFGIFRPCLYEHRKARAGVLPKLQEVVVGTPRLRGVARERARSCQLQARHRGHRIDEDDAAMIENPLELAGSFNGLTSREVRHSANVNGVQAAEASDEADATESEKTWPFTLISTRALVDEPAGTDRRR
jgi:hypothetical protein